MKGRGSVGKRGAPPLSKISSLKIEEMNNGESKRGEASLKNLFPLSFLRSGGLRG